MRSSIITLVLLLSIGVSWAGDRNRIIALGVRNFTYTPKEGKETVGSALGSIANVLITGQNTTQQPQYKDAVRAAIVRGLTSGFRTIATDMGNIGEQTNATFDYYVDATINNISTTTKTESITTTKNGVNTYYKAMVGITLQFKDSQTEEVIASPMFKISDVDVAWIETEESAITSTLRKLSAYVGGYCNRKYPIYGTILESARQSKDKQKEVYIDLGTNLGAYKGLHLTAYTVKTIAGKEAKTQVGKLKIMDVQGEVQLLFLPANPPELETQIVPISPSGDKVVIDFPLFSNRHRRVAEGFRDRGGFIPVFFDDEIVGADGIGLHPPLQPFRFFGVLQLFKIAAL